MPEPPVRWNYEYITPSLIMASEMTDVVYAGETQYQRVEIIDTVPFGRCLV